MNEQKELILEDGVYVTEIPAVVGPARSSSAKRPTDTLEITAPIPGVVAAVLKAVGDDVAAGECVLCLEAMKMENEIAAAVSGRVEKIAVKAGDRVKKNDILARLTLLKNNNE